MDFRLHGDDPGFVKTLPGRRKEDFFHSSEQAERLCEIPADESFRFGKRISLSVEAVSVVGSSLMRGDF